MSASATFNVHADIDDLRAKRLEHGAVVLDVGDYNSPVWLGLFLGQRTKADTLACLARWVELVNALPDNPNTTEAGVS